MKDLLSNKKNKNFTKMTLSGYYKALPTQSPRLSFIRKVAKEAGVSEVTVVNWCNKGMRPQRYEHVIVLSKNTGIKPEDLWER